MFTQNKLQSRDQDCTLRGNNVGVSHTIPTVHDIMSNCVNLCRRKMTESFIFHNTVMALYEASVRHMCGE